MKTYQITKVFPPEERYGLSNQMRRAAVSITSNIAEGFGRFTYKEKIRFYSLSHGSLTELQNHFLISKDVGFLQEGELDEIWNQTIRVKKLLNGLIRSSKMRI